MVYFVARRVPIILQKNKFHLVCETGKNQVILFSEIRSSQSVRVDIIIFCAVLSVTPLTRKKTIHVIKALLI